MASHVYEVHPRRDKRGADQVSDALPFGRLWYTEILHTIGYADFYSCSHPAVIRVYDNAEKHVETHGYRGDFNEP